MRCADAMLLWQVLNLGTGDYDLVYSVPASYTSPATTLLNAAGLNPVDGKNYAVVRHGSTAYLSRFDANAIEVLGKLEGETVAGTFDTNGTFYYSFPQGNNQLYKIEGAPMLLILCTHGNAN